MKTAVVAGLLLGSLVVATIFITNVQGWPALFISRLLSVSNPPTIAQAPAGFRPKVPPGFSVSVFASGLRRPRWLAVAPNGDVFVSESGAGQISVLHQRPGEEKSYSSTVFVSGLSLPFGVAFRDQYVYVAKTNEVVRYRYDQATSKRLGSSEHLVDLPGGGYNQHWTRSLAFDRAGRLFVSVGSRTNVGIEPDPRAAILAIDSAGGNMRVFARGLRNAPGIGVNPTSNDLWATVNERDNLGDDEPQDYFTRVTDGGFYGWPYAYDGGKVDRRVQSRPELVSTTVRPDLQLGGHVAPLQFAFYAGGAFPDSYRDGAFIALHGSWNRRSRSGYEVVFVPFANGLPSGKPETFLGGFVPDPAGSVVYGRPVGIAVAHDGALLVSDDGGEVIWRVSFGAAPDSGE